MMKLVKTVALGALVLGLTTPTAFAADSSADLFKGKCAMCHGENGAGKGKVPALSLAEGAAEVGCRLQDRDRKGREE
jgi:mono/diheme cytochrome c family protein